MSNADNLSKNTDMSALPEHCLIQFPAGSWGFVGSVDTRLAFVSKDGSEATAEQIKNAQQFGPRLAGVKTRSWETKQDAIDAAAALGYDVKAYG